MTIEEVNLQFKFNPKIGNSSIEFKLRHDQKLKVNQISEGGESIFNRIRDRVSRVMSFSALALGGIYEMLQCVDQNGHFLVN